MKERKMRKGSKILVKLVLVLSVALIVSVTAQPVRVASAETVGPSCATPSTPEEVERCNQLEQQILASTVRLVWQIDDWDEEARETDTFNTNSHATVKQGRYLVTHNHLDPTWTLVGVSIYRANGELIWQTLMTNVSVVLQDTETVVYDFGTLNGQGLFTALGVPSAQFASWHDLSVQTGMEVAQVDWNGATAHVDWVTINSVTTDDGTPSIELDNYARNGASGGGIFLNGCHIANNWYRVRTSIPVFGIVLWQFTVGALNSSEVGGQS
jgi:hypothetical protein